MLQRRIKAHLGWTLLLVAFWALGNKSIEMFLLNAVAESKPGASAGTRR